MIGWDVLLRHKPMRDLQLETHISLKNRYIYFSVSRAGSSSIKFHLQQFEFRGTGRKVVNVNDRHLSPHIWPDQLSDTDFFELLRAPDVLRIAFTRNPYARLLSCYLYRIVDDTPSRTRMLREMQREPASAVSFDEFIRHICSQNDPAAMDRHWRPQSECIFYPEIDMGFLGDSEDLENELFRLDERLGGGLDRSAIKSVNASPGQTSAASKLNEYYTPVLRDLVRQRYADDFRLFKYSSELF